MDIWLSIGNDQELVRPDLFPDDILEIFLCPDHNGILPGKTQDQRPNKMTK